MPDADEEEQDHEIDAEILYVWFGWRHGRPQGGWRAAIDPAIKDTARSTRHGSRPQPKIKAHRRGAEDAETLFAFSLRPRRLGGEKSFPSGKGFTRK
jgi:hypothetical protein